MYFRERDMMGRFTKCVAAMVLCAVPLGCASHSCGADTAAAKPKNFIVYIGTYTKTPKSKGIYECRLNAQTGELSPPELAGEMGNPSFVAISPDHRFLYATGEGGYTVEGDSAIGAFAIKPDGKLTFINQQPAHGSSTCYDMVDPSGKNVMIASYGTGNVAILRVADNGAIAPASSIDQHKADDPKLTPRAHCIDLDPTGKFALCCDLGLDRVYVYHFDAAAGTLTLNDPAFVSIKPGSGPRHLVFSPDGKFVYSIDELGSAVTAFSWDGEHGTLKQIQMLSTLPSDFTGKSSCAEIAMHPSGKFLYGSNRGHDSIVEYSVDKSTGMLTLVGHTSTQGNIPRGFGVDPTGHWLIVGNQNSDSLVEFSIDQNTGELKPTGTKYEVGMPVCVKFMEAN
jgi:6-phosphogluconolactonase